MTTIQLHLPDDLASKAVRISGNIETLIIDLLRTKINELDKPVTLADEYRLAGIEKFFAQCPAFNFAFNRSFGGLYRFYNAGNCF